MIGRLIPRSVKHSRFGVYLQRVLYPLMPGWVDEGRRLVQVSHLEEMLRRANLDHSQARQVLNAGAGEGLYSDLLASIPEASSIVEFDVSYAHHNRAKRFGSQMFVAASLTAIPFRSSHFDLILCSEVLEHVPDDRAALNELVRVMRVGGWLLISVPTLPAVFDPNHVREGYTAEDLSGLLEDRKLDICAVTFCMHATFKFFLRSHRPGLTPKAWVWLLAWLDRRFPIGSPMDLIILARKPEIHAP